MKQITPEKWFEIANNLYEAICLEIESFGKEGVATSESKLISMYNFFRLWRGEAFYNVRPAGVGEYQKDIYAMEDSILSKLTDLEIDVFKSN